MTSNRKENAHRSCRYDGRELEMTCNSFHTYGDTSNEQYTIGQNTQAQFMKPAEAARLCDVSTRTITRMCCDGTIVAVKMRKSWRINRDAFMHKFGLA